MRILDHFPGEPRPVQAEVLQEVERVWHQADVIALLMPVGSGKSRCAVAIGRAVNQPAVITTPTRVLMEQYKDDFPDLDWVGRKSDYPTDRSFLRAKTQATRNPLFVTNYHVVCANRLQKPVMILDESHNALRLHQERHAFHIWKDDYFWPDSIETMGDAISWLETVKDPKLTRVLEEIKNAGIYTLEISEAYLRGKYKECMKFIPLTIKDKDPWLWNRNVKKLVLMSATISRQDLKELGLDKKRTCIIEAPSPIPVECRPVVFDPVAPMDFETKPESIKLMARKLEALLQKHPEKGVIHCTYDVSARLKPLLRSSRLMFHTKDNRSEVYERFLRSKDKVLVGCGFSEGIDLAGDRARWQVVVQTPFPNIKDPAVEAKARQEPEWYSWEASKVLLQTFGRVCRGPDDYGVTYILDTNFRRLWKKQPKLFADVLTTNQFVATFRA